jgi:CheY-like chemotaxis protein
MKTIADIPATVLIVNDDQMQLDLLRDLLEPEGYKIFLAQDGQRALDLTRTRAVEMVISDVVMPGMDGMELCRRLKKSPHTATIPVLLASAIRKEEAALLDFLSLPHAATTSPTQKTSARSLKPRRCCVTKMDLLVGLHVRPF